MTKENIIHHLHTKEGVNEYAREVAIQGINRTVMLSSNYPNENMDFLIVKALGLFKDIKEVDE